ncbi:hypothetical protein LOK49_LG04G03073 [Camellia lanceoleosa]|uniref:Uncharacterized protein n=1 Tax=Camellia lanceoleosa TaxID=1840588 RepID=A0ACC0I1P1_9ERIC|nr:hypothetical protein LOK49_LG04G03073 [Camellia lanceoleosa]
MKEMKTKMKMKMKMRDKVEQGLEYNEKVFPSISNEVLKAVVAQFNANQLFTERPSVSALVRESLVHRAKDFNIVLDNVAITHLSCGAEISKAVEQKAEGETKAVKLILDAIAAAGMGLIDLRKIEALREIAVTLAKTPNVAYLPNANNMLLGLNPSMVGR